MNITLEEIITIIGQPKKETNSMAIWDCGYCGHKNGWEFDKRKLTFFCHTVADAEHSWEVFKKVGEMRRNLGQVSSYERKSVPLNPPKKISAAELWQEIIQYSGNIEKNIDNIADYLYLNWGITPNEAANFNIVYNPVSKVLLQPLFSRDSIVDIEYRQTETGKSNIKTTQLCANEDKKNASSLAWFMTGNDILYIAEGFKDATTLSIYLKEKGKHNFAVATGWYGCGTILKGMKNIDLSTYREVKILCDMDNAGNDTIDKIIEQFPFCQKANDFLKNTNHYQKYGKADFTDFFLEYRKVKEWQP